MIRLYRKQTLAQPVIGDFWDALRLLEAKHPKEEHLREWVNLLSRRRGLDITSAKGVSAIEIIRSGDVILVDYEEIVVYRIADNFKYRVKFGRSRYLTMVAAV